jgi:hypothetical protein
VALVVLGSKATGLLNDDERPKFAMSLEVDVTVRVWSDGKVRGRTARTWIDVAFDESDFAGVTPGGQVAVNAPPVGYTEVGIQSSPTYVVGDPVWVNASAA